MSVQKNKLSFNLDSSLLTAVSSVVIRFQKLTSLKEIGGIIILLRRLVLNDIRIWDSRLPVLWLELEIHTG